MFRKFLCLLRNAILCQDSLCPSIRFCCFDFPFLSPRCFEIHSFWRDDLDSDGRMREPTPFLKIFSGWHNAEIFTICPTLWSRFFVSAGSSNRVSIANSRPLRTRLQLVFAYCSGLAFGQGYGSLIDVISRSGLAVCTLKMFLHVATSELMDTLQSDTRLQTGVPNLVSQHWYVL